MDARPKLTPTAMRADQQGHLPGLLGFEWTRIGGGTVEGRLAVEPRHLAPHGFLHGATVVALADTACGYGCLDALPAGATGFTTIELKTNFLGTARVGAIACAARLVHAGRSTQVWDAEVKNETSGKTIALFRCTQMLLYPAAASA